MIKKFFAAMIAVIILLVMPLSVVAAGTLYTDSTTDVSFTVPDGWVETNLNEQREVLKAKFEPLSQDGATLVFGVYDVWSQISASEKIGYSRSDFDQNMMKEALSGEDLSSLFGLANMGATEKTVYFNNVEYIQLYITTDMTVFDITVNVKMYYLIHCENGYMFSFGYSDTENTPHYQDFVTVMNSVIYPNVSGDTSVITDDSSSSSTSSAYVPSYDYETDSTYTTNTNKETGKGSGVVYLEEGELKFDFPLLIISLIFTIVIYSLPIIIYRYVIKKQPLPEKMAKKLTIIYGIVAFIVMAILNGGQVGAAIILWSFINYRMLIRPSKNDVYVINNTDTPTITQPVENAVIKEHEIIDSSEPVLEKAEETIEEIQQQMPETEQIEPIPEQEPVVEQPKPIVNRPQPRMTKNVLFCRKCGTRLTVDSEFCHKCGIRVIK